MIINEKIEYQLSKFRTRKLIAHTNTYPNFFFVFSIFGRNRAELKLFCVYFFENFCFVFHFTSAF
jgi:hypothetical protein